jgi:hypothetical protein
MPSSRGRKKSKERQARQTQSAQRRAEKRKLTPAEYSRRRALGWGLVALAILVAGLHWTEHLGVVTVFPGIVSELALGYPMAGVLGVAGAVVLSK